MAEKILIATGDIGPNRPDAGEMFEQVKGVLKEADLVFGQLEPCLASTGSPAAQPRLPMRCRPENAKVIADAGYDVISFATNHCMDWGRPAFFQTISLINENGMSAVGAGANLDEARKPVIKVLDDGTRVGFLAYCSILPQDYWANSERPGANPLRGVTAYVPKEHDQPETPVRMFSFPHPDDLDNMLEDIARLRPQVDILAVSFHWGIHFIPAVIAYYQKYAARFAIDAGADIIIGHHEHILKPIEVYKGKVIIYGMANFALEGPERFFEGEGDLRDSASHKDIAALNPDMAVKKRTMPDDSYKSMAVKCYIEDKRIKKVTFLPVQLDFETNIPRFLKRSDPEFDEIVRYMTDITIDQKITPRFAVEGDEVRIVTD